MSRPMFIAPSILSADFGHLAAQVRDVDRAGADMIHVDVMDGHFVPNLTLGPMIVEAVRKSTDKVVDVHLMIANAENFIARYADAGADIIAVHAEAVTHLHGAIHKIIACGKRPAVALNPATPLSVLEYVLEDLHMVLLLSVNPGFGGQTFIDAVVPKIRALRELADVRNPELLIEVDGGVKLENVAVIAAAGANVFISGSGIFKPGHGQKEYSQTIAALRMRATEAIGAGS